MADMTATVTYDDAQTSPAAMIKADDRPGLPGGGLEAARAASARRPRREAARMNTDKAIGAIIVSGLAVLCCAGPALVATVGAPRCPPRRSPAARRRSLGRRAHRPRRSVRRHNRPTSAGADCCAAEGVEGKAQS